MTGSRSPSRRSSGRRVECDSVVCTSAGSGPGSRCRSLSVPCHVLPPSSLGSSPNSALPDPDGGVKSPYTP